MNVMSGDSTVNLTCFLSAFRCLDIYEYDRSRREKETERVQALRLFRRIASLSAAATSVAAAAAASAADASIPLRGGVVTQTLPESLVRSLVAIGCNYANEKVRVCEHAV